MLSSLLALKQVKISPAMNNDTTFDPSPLVPELGEYILIPFVGFTLFGILASLDLPAGAETEALGGLQLQRAELRQRRVPRRARRTDGATLETRGGVQRISFLQLEPSAQTVMSHPAQDISASGGRGGAELGQHSTGAGSHCWEGDLQAACHTNK
ncbi:hypothetical protein SKAU_G00044750 [Synaphobranchus kaupii]|uniref:Uncharacterized protein n=1 Tax=Synaphobranchus kaupii TaxID=118154 RepID=A0A9Q1G350_SYNKA|nr:hypothetical protein SKAU_G00044750 [Synaphobranchus kaupii]